MRLHVLRRLLRWFRDKFCDAEVEWARAALLAGVGAGVYTDLEEAGQEAVRLPEERVVPDTARQAAYEERYGLYRELYLALRPLQRDCECPGFQAWPVS
jgi:sugar (pentulose or hexulose) kinase